MTTSTAPKTDELEVSVFGPGLGECILVHLGHNEWCMIDSCVGRGKSLPAAVEYLRGLGPEAIGGVQIIVATHWHDDHINGIAKSLQEFTNAKFSCSMALRNELFVRLVQLQNMSVRGNSGVDEFGEVLKILQERKTKGAKPERVSPGWAIQDRPLLYRSKNGRAFPAKVTALSPSDITVKLALDKFSELFPKNNQPQGRVANVSPNEGSVVLVIEVGCRRVLLGADLEHRNRAGEGWLAVLNSCETPLGPAQIFKVAHHGSPNADCLEVWEELLDTDPIAIVTPFASGRGLPQPGDLARLRDRTANLYCTANPKAKLPTREKSVEKRLKDRDRIALEGPLGHVRVRWSVSNHSAAPRVELFNGAYKV